MNKQLAISLMVSSGLLFACSKGGGGGSGVNGKTTEPLETEMYGTYQAFLSPVNKSVSGHLNGTVALVREREDLTIDVRLSGGPISSLHTQSIHVGDRCPTEADDLNGDGYVDGEEGALIYKEIIIPLDDDISSQRMGGGIYPVSDSYGYYLWSRTTAFEKVMEDLREEDINLTDDYIKLDSNKSLTMIGKVAVILGVPETTVLPETVLGRGRKTPHQAIPIACGVIRRLGQIPGKVDIDDTGLPVPDGETIGGSSGADDGAIFTPGTTDGSTGNYGEDDEPETTDNSTEHGTTHGGLTAVTTTDGSTTGDSIISGSSGATGGTSSTSELGVTEESGI